MDPKVGGTDLQKGWGIFIGEGGWTKKLVETMADETLHWYKPYLRTWQMESEVEDLILAVEHDCQDWECITAEITGVSEFGAQ